MAMTKVKKRLIPMTDRDFNKLEALGGAGWLHVVLDQTTLKVTPPTPAAGINEWIFRSTTNCTIDGMNRMTAEVDNILCKFYGEPAGYFLKKDKGLT